MLLGNSTLPASYVMSGAAPFVAFRSDPWDERLQHNRSTCSGGHIQRDACCREAEGCWVVQLLKQRQDLQTSQRVGRGTRGLLVAADARSSC